MRRSTIHGLAGLLGAGVFVLSLTVLHLARPEIDWRQDYVSHFAHSNLGWVFVLAAVAHGFGNLALSLGLGRILWPSRPQRWAVLLFATAAVSVMLAVLLPIDPAGAPLTLVGIAHRGVVYIGFPGELAALFLFSVAFARDPHWRRRTGASFVLSVIAALALACFLIAVLLNWVPGLAERFALAGFMAWEFWAALHLARQPAVHWASSRSPDAIRRQRLREESK